MDSSKLHYDPPLYYNPNTLVTIYPGCLLSSSLPVAIKVQLHSSLKLANQSISEALSQATLCHPHICRVIGCFIEEQGAGECRSQIVMERMVRDLKQEMDMRRGEKRAFREEELMEMLWAVVKALAYAEREGISHRDIKPSNIFLCEDLKTVKIGDFGSAEWSFSSQIETKTIAGTPLYLSPELKRVLLQSIRGNVPDFSLNPIKADVYSLGLTMFALATLEQPEMFATIELLQNITQTALEKIANFPYFHAFISKMLQINPESRPSFVELEQELKPFFAEIPAKSVQTLCFACNSPIKSSDWQAYLPDELRDVCLSVKVCSWTCLQQLCEDKTSKIVSEMCVGCGKEYSWMWIGKVSLKCGHVFHNKECFASYVGEIRRVCGRSEEIFCQICRTPIAGEVLQEIFEEETCVKCKEKGKLSICVPCNHLLCANCTRKSLSTGCIQCQNSSFFGFFG